MEIFTTASEDLVITRHGTGIGRYDQIKAKQKSLMLRTIGGELEWELQYTADYIISSTGLYFSYKLVPLHGQNLMRTVSYSFKLTIPQGYNKIDPPKNAQLVNETYRCRSERHGECFSGNKLGMTIRIRLAGGEVTGLTSSSRLYNKKEGSDLEIKCDDLVINAHQNVLSVHSDTLRTVLSSQRQCVADPCKHNLYRFTDLGPFVRIGICLLP